jgi:hypothetical protein
MRPSSRLKAKYSERTKATCVGDNGNQSTEAVVRSGDLKMLKVTGTKETWTKRYIVLTATTFAYYSNQQVCQPDTQSMDGIG